MFRPAASTWKLGEPLKFVLVEAEMSAAPPNSSGTAFAIALITTFPAMRVATFLASGPDGKLGISFSHPSASLPATTRSNSAAGSGYAFLYSANCASHSACSFLPFGFAVSQFLRASSGT